MHRSRLARAGAGIGIVSIALVLGTASLALAGVSLPAPAADAFKRVGISPPNQAGGGVVSGRARSGEVQGVIDATAPTDRGCEFGHRVAEAAKGSPLPEKARAACARGDETKAKAPGRSRKAGAAGRGFGEETAERARGLREATVEQRRQFGRDTAARARKLGGAGAQKPAPQRPSGSPAKTPAGPPAHSQAPAEAPSGPPAEAPGGPRGGRP